MLRIELPGSFFWGGIDLNIIDRYLINPCAQVAVAGYTFTTLFTHLLQLGGS
jgi:hypothetical protein